MNITSARKLAKESAPRCSPSDGCNDRYRVWLEYPSRTVDGRNFIETKIAKGRTKSELVKALVELPDGFIVDTATRLR